MREYTKNSEPQSRTLDSNPKASRQAPVDVIIQRYKERSIQRYASAEEEEPLQRKSDAAQREEVGEEELLQGKFGASTAQREKIPSEGGEANLTGMPDKLKSGIESLSGYSMDDVRVHYNSSKPSQLQALAYAQGTDIHIAPGQEQHLPHEAWHVVQQKQGRVQPTTQLHGVNVNDNEGLEREADVMGGKAIENISERIGIVQNKGNLKDSSIQCLRSKLNFDKDTYKKKTMSTVYLFAQMDEKDIGCFETTKDKHAEENLIDFITSNPSIIGKVLKIYLSTSPCSSTFGTRVDGKQGCQEKLEELKSRGITVSVAADHLYQPQSTGAMERSLGFPTGSCSFSSAYTSPFETKIFHLPKCLHEDQLQTAESVAQFFKKNNNEGLEKVDVVEGMAVQMKNINILTPVVQRVTQKQAENIMSQRLDINDEIIGYGGLCGGWSMALLQEEEALTFWEELESLEIRGLLFADNVVGWDNFFIKVMKYQYELDRSDAYLYDGENEERRETLLSLKGALEKVGEKVFWDKDAAKYDINNCKNIKQNNWSILKKEIIERGGVLIATETHFMSVKLLNKNTFIVSETNSIGYKRGTWEEITDYLDKEITGKVSLKFFTKTKPKLGKKQKKNLLS